MRDNRFIAEHRGGLLTKKHHRQLMIWACICTEHVLTLLGGTLDERLKNAFRKPASLPSIFRNLKSTSPDG